MSDLNKLTIAEARDALRAGKVSAVASTPDSIRRCSTRCQTRSWIE